MSWQQLWHQAHYLYKIKPVKIPAWEGGSRQEVPPPASELLGNWQLLRDKVSSSVIWSLRGYSSPVDGPLPFHKLATSSTEWILRRGGGLLLFREREKSWTWKGIVLLGNRVELYVWTSQSTFKVRFWLHFAVRSFRPCRHVATSGQFQQQLNPPLRPKLVSSSLSPKLNNQRTCLC